MHPNSLSKQISKDMLSYSCETVSPILDLGFSENAGRLALALIGEDIDLAIEWLRGHPLEQGGESLHLTLATLLPFMPSLSDPIGEILSKVEDPEITLNLLGQIGKSGLELLEEPSLFELASGMIQMDHAFISTFEIFHAASSVLLSICNHNREALELMKENMVNKYLLKFVEKATEFPVPSYNWLDDLFGIIYMLEDEPEALDTIQNFCKVNGNSPYSLINLSGMLYLIQLITKLYPKDPNVFLETESLIALLVIKTQTYENVKQEFISAVFSLIKVLAEDENVLQVHYESLITQFLTEEQRLDYFLRSFIEESSKNAIIFQKAVQNTCTVFRNKGSIFVKIIKYERFPAVLNSFVIKTLAEALKRIYEIEQSNASNLLLHSEHLISIIADLLQFHPILIGDLLNHSLKTTDSITEIARNRKFVGHLLRNFFSFRYTLLINDSNLVFNIPGTAQSVTPFEYQNWVKIQVKLLSSLVFKQSTDSYTFDKSRNVVFRELRDMLAEQNRKGNFVDGKSLSILRTVTIMIMQLLKEDPGVPFSNANSAEIGKILAEKFKFIQLLSESAVSVNLSQKKAVSILNLILAPIELLLRGNIHTPIEFEPEELDVYSDATSSQTYSSDEEEDDESDEIEDEECSDSNEYSDSGEYEDEDYWSDEIEEYPSTAIYEINQQLYDNLTQTIQDTPKFEESNLCEIKLATREALATAKQTRRTWTSRFKREDSSLDFYDTMSMISEIEETKRTDFLSELAEDLRDEIIFQLDDIHSEKNSFDIDLNVSLLQISDSFIELLLKAVFLKTPLNTSIYTPLIVSLCSDFNIRGKFIDGLLCLLVQTHGEFLEISEGLGDNYTREYTAIASRILDLLVCLVKKIPKASYELSVPTIDRLPLIRKIKGNREITGLKCFLALSEQKVYKNNRSHLSQLNSLLGSIVENQEFPPVLDELSVTKVLNLMRSLTEVKPIIKTVTKLAYNDTNNSLIIKYLSLEVEFLSNFISSNLWNSETSPNGQKELELLLLFKILKNLGGSASIECLWEPLTNVLSTISDIENDIACSSTLNELLPIIEAFFLAHTDTYLGEDFHIFCDKNRKLLNLLVKQNPSLLNDTFKSLVQNFPYLLDFENKMNFFRAEIRKLRPEVGFDNIKVHVRRNEVFMDSYHQLKVRKPEEMHGKLRVQFVDEEGIDAGGVAREWYSLLAREMFNPNYALFIPSANGVSFQPNSMSYINSEHHEYFKFVGRIIGKALCDGYHLDVYFTRSLYKHILGQEVTYHDMEDLDPNFFKSLQLLHNIDLNESELHEYYFAYEVEEFGNITLKELVPGGKNIRVTEWNKDEYVQLICHMKMTKNIQTQIDSFLEGFYEIVPKNLIGIFDSKELELLISGLPEFDIEDLKANTEYHNYTEDSCVIKWLWETLYDFSNEERAEFLQFVTGSSKVPLEGFKALPGMGGVQKFQIHKSFTDPVRLPTAHTCLNQLDLPEYPSCERLKRMLKIAISEGKEGFGFS